MKHILFVDNDPIFLDGLRACIHRHASDWACTFATNGSDAIAELQRMPCDVIVSDIRMDGMDGVRLLRTVAERWPDAVRVALTEGSDGAQAMRLVPIAHQCLSKPCEPSVLENLIERCFALQDLLRAPQLRAAVGRLRQLPPLRGIFQRLQVMIEDPGVDVRDVAQLVGSDTVIAAKVLQLANSAFFRANRRITSIEQAVTHLGFATLRNLVRSAEVFAAWPAKAPTNTLNFDWLQEHCQQVVAISHALVSKLEQPLLEDDAVLAALVHDLGYWVLANQCPHELERARQRSLTHSISMHEAERDTLGATHAEIGAYLLGIWGFPYPVVEAVAHHHAPLQVRQTALDALAVLAIAHAVAPTNDADAFEGFPPGDLQVDDSYLGVIHAPFTWQEATSCAHHTVPQSQGERRPRAL